MFMQVEKFADGNSVENHWSQKKVDILILCIEYIFRVTTTFWDETFLGNNGKENGRMESKTFWKFYQNY